MPINTSNTAMHNKINPIRINIEPPAANKVEYSPNNSVVDPLAPNSIKPMLRINRKAASRKDKTEMIVTHTGLPLFFTGSGLLSTGAGAGSGVGGIGRYCF